MQPVYGIAQYHVTIRQRCQDNRDAAQCSKHQRNEALFAELHSINVIAGQHHPKNCETVQCSKPQRNEA